MDDKIMNPQTGRYVDKNGKIGHKIRQQQQEDKFSSLESFYNFEINENINGLVAINGNKVDMFAVLSDDAKKKYKNWRMIDDKPENKPFVCRQNSYEGTIAKASATFHSGIYTLYDNNRNPTTMKFNYDIFLHTFYNCFAYSNLDVLIIPEEVVRGIARKLLCYTFMMLKQLGVIDDDQVIFLEADGVGPSTNNIHDDDADDRRPLADYYHRSFGFEPVVALKNLITGPVDNIEREIPMRTNVISLITNARRYEK